MRSKQRAITAFSGVPKCYLTSGAVYAGFIACSNDTSKGCTVHEPFLEMVTLHCTWARFYGSFGLWYEL